MSISKIEKRLRDLQKQNVEYISLNDMLQMIDTIRYNARVKRAEKKEITNRPQRT